MTPPNLVQPRPEVVTRDVSAERPPWVERATSADHKIVGQLYLATALTFIALAAVEFALMRLQLIVPQNSMIEPEIFNRLLSIAPVSLVVLGVIPLAIGVIGHIVPLQIGARGVALPRLNQLSYWLYLTGGVTLYASMLYTAPESGTIGLPALSDTVFNPSNGADAWIAGTALACAGFTCFAINLIVTLRQMRAPGIAWRRLPLFSWAATVIGYLLLVTAPAMISALTMLEIDRHFGGVFFDAGEGGAPLLYEHLAYFFFTGAYVIVFLFAAGAISEILPTFARKPIFSHRARGDLVRAHRRPRPARLDAEHVRRAAERGLDADGDGLRGRARGPDRPPDPQLGGDDLGRRARAAGRDLVRARLDLAHGHRPRGRARELGDPGRLAGREHDRVAGRHAAGAASAAAWSAASPRCTTGSRSSAGGCSARASARRRWWRSSPASGSTCW